MTKVSDTVKFRGVDVVGSVEITARGGSDREVLETVQSIRETVEAELPSVEDDLEPVGGSDG